MNGNASSSANAAMRSATSLRLTVSSSATDSRVGESIRRLIRRFRAASTMPGSAQRSTSIARVSKNASCTSV